MDKLKYINLGFISPEFHQSVWEYPKILELTFPTLFVSSSNKTAVGMRGIDPLEKRIKTENLPGEMGFFRYRGAEVNSVFVVSPNVIQFVLHYPDTGLFKEMGKSVKAIVFTTLRKINFEIKNKKDGNDLYFLKDGAEKKFLGIMEDSLFNGWKSILFCITLEFDTNFANKIYRFDDENFKKKGNISDIGTIVGGLKEIKPDLNRDEIISEVVQGLAERFGMQVEKNELTEDESSKMEKLTGDFNNKNWHLYGK